MTACETRLPLATGRDLRRLRQAAQNLLDHHRIRINATGNANEATKLCHGQVRR